MISRKGNSLSVIFSMAWRPSLWGGGGEGRGAGGVWFAAIG